MGKPKESVLTQFCRHLLILLLLASPPAFALDSMRLWSNDFLSSSVNESLYDQSITWGISWGGNSPRNENEDRLFSLASVKKVITAATSLRELGSDFKFSNEFTGELDAGLGVLLSPTFSVSGDPTWGVSAYGETLTSRVSTVVRRLLKMKVNKVVGRIEIQLLRPAVGQFKRPAAWKKEWQLVCYAALPTPVSLNGNCAELSIESEKNAAWKTAGVSTPVENKLVSAKQNSIVITPMLDTMGRVEKYVLTGGIATAVSEFVPVHNNEDWLRNLFIQELSAVGIEYEENSTVSIQSKMLKKFYVDLSSKPLKEMLVPFLRNSINLMGDRLNIEASQDFITLAALLPNPADYQNVTLVDGSGLMAGNKVSPKTFLQILDSLKKQPYFQDLYNGLPVSGVNGTLQDRMDDALLKEKVHAKTGTINRVANLAGYWTKSDQSLEPFVIFTESGLPASAARAKIDEVVAEFARKN